MKRNLLFTLTFMLGLGASAQGQAPAFPGAEGNGRYVTGGRGGKVVHVTNLNDRGTGSLRAAVSGNAKKIVVFDVGGVIPLASNLNIGANTTILGQTAPYPGITLRYYTVSPGGDNIIIRFIRCRRGQEKDVNDGADAIWTRNHTGLILDHCSFSWSIDEVASFYDNNNFTMQWCTVGESLNNAGHNKGAHGYGGIWGGKLASFHHNMIAHVNNRAPRFNGARYNWTGYTANKDYSKYGWANAVQAENVDFRNCLVFDWGDGGCYGGPGGGYINMVNNYYKSTPETSRKNRVTQVSIANSTTSSDEKTYLDMTSRYYISGNYVYGYGENYDWKGVVYDSGIQNIGGQYYTLDSLYAYGHDVPHVNNAKGVPCVSIKLDEAKAPAGEVTTHTAENAYNKILTYCGASFFRDDVDGRYMAEAKEDKSTYAGSVTKVKGRIDLVSDVNGYTEKNFPKGSRPAGYDSDNDGMPDAWETANGLNPNDASDALTYNLDSRGYYTNLETYANSLVEDIMKNENKDALSAVDEYYPTTVKADGIEYYTGRLVELLSDTTQNDTTHVAGTTGTLTWKMEAGTAEEAVLADAAQAGIGSSAMALGSHLTYAGTRSISGVGLETLFQPTEQDSVAMDENAVVFSFTTKGDYTFKPTSVSFITQRVGTDGGLLDVTYYAGESATVLATGVVPPRNNATPAYAEVKQTVNGVEPYAGTHKLVINIYKLGTTKTVGLRNVTVTGELISPTGIRSTVTLQGRPVSSNYYTLNGQRVSTLQKGQVVVLKNVYADGHSDARKVVVR